MNSKKISWAIAAAAVFSLAACGGDDDVAATDTAAPVISDTGAMAPMPPATGDTTVSPTTP